MNYQPQMAVIKGQNVVLRKMADDNKRLKQELEECRKTIGELRKQLALPKEG